MYTKTVVLLLTAAVASGAGWAAQGRGQGPSNPQGKGRPASMEQGRQRQGGSQRGPAQRQRERIQVSQQQRDRLMSCSQSAQQVRQRARQLSRAGKGGTFDVAQARQQRDQLRTHTNEMLREQDRFLQGLNEGQRRQLQDRILKMDQSRQRLQDCLQTIHRELEGENPNPKNVRKQAQRLEKESKRFEKHFRKLDGQLVVEP